MAVTVGEVDGTGTSVPIRTIAGILVTRERGVATSFAAKKSCAVAWVGVLPYLMAATGKLVV